MVPPRNAPKPEQPLLIAGVGNVLRGDDGFGIEVVRRLQAEIQTDAVRVVETGIAGISLVQELMTGYAMLVVVDAVQSGRPAGTLSFEALDIPDLRRLPEKERRPFLADTHYANPSRALMLARAVGVLPPRVFLLGGHLKEAEDFGARLSSTGETAVKAAIAWLREWVGQA